LKIAGDGPIRTELERYVQNKKIDRIEFLGFCSPKQLYQESEILCLTSTIEGLNMVLIEGMANGCVPIAYGSFSAIYDLVQSGKNGFVVKPFSQRKYLKCLKRLMTDQDMREKMRENNMDILSGFDKDLIVKEWLQLYSTCIQEKK
jgi:glycosyltransferase involved in cell wall biosynthesis